MQNIFVPKCMYRSIESVFDSKRDVRLLSLALKGAGLGLDKVWGRWHQAPIPHALTMMEIEKITVWAAWSSPRRPVPGRRCPLQLPEKGNVSNSIPFDSIPFDSIAFSLVLFYLLIHILCSPHRLFFCSSHRLSSVPLYFSFLNITGIDPRRYQGEGKGGNSFSPNLASRYQILSVPQCVFILWFLRI